MRTWAPRDQGGLIENDLPDYPACPEAGAHAPNAPETIRPGSVRLPYRAPHHPRNIQLTRNTLQPQGRAAGGHAHYTYNSPRGDVYVSRSDGAVACLARRLDGYLDDGVGDSGISSEHDRYDDDTCAHIYVNVYYVYACTCAWGQVRLRRRLLPA